MKDQKKLTSITATEKKTLMPKTRLKLWLSTLILLSITKLAIQKKDDDDEASEREKIHTRHAPEFVTVYLAELISPGVKTPATPIKSAEFINRYGIDTLMPNGERQHYTLGAQIREDYEDLFQKYTLPQDYDIYSASPSYCQASARAHLAGLFPKHKHDSLNTNANDTTLPPWIGIEDIDEPFVTSLPFGAKPFAMKMESEELDLIFLPWLYKACPKAAREEATQKTRHNIVLQNEIKGFGQKLLKQGFSPKAFFKKEIWTARQLSIVNDFVFSKYYFDNTLLKKLKPKDYSKLKLISGVHKVLSNFPTESFQRLYTHRIAELILEAFSLGPKEGEKYTLFSGFDKNIMAFMIGFGLFDHECLLDRFRKNSEETDTCRDPPQYASNFLFEMSQRVDNKRHYVRVLYNGAPIKFCHGGKKNLTAEYCPIDDFIEQFMDKMMLDNFSKFCGSQDVSADDTVQLKRYLSKLRIYKIFLVAACITGLILTGAVVYLFGKADKRFFLSDPKELQKLKREGQQQQGETKDQYDARVNSQPTEPAELELPPYQPNDPYKFDASKDPADEDGYNDPSFRFDNDDLEEERRQKKRPVDVTDTDRQGIVNDDNKENNVVYSGRNKAGGNIRAVGVEEEDDDDDFKFSLRKKKQGGKKPRSSRGRRKTEALEDNDNHRQRRNEGFDRRHRGSDEEDDDDYNIKRRDEGRTADRDHSRE